MKKVLILVLGLSLTAASCNIFGGTTGSKGVLKSEDGGQTFTASNALETKGSISGLNVNSMIADPKDSDTIYVGSGGGIYRTTDGAVTWKLILTGMKIAQVKIDPSNSDILYAAGMNATNGLLIKSIDRGETWKDIYTEPTKNNPVLSVAISPLNNKIVLAGLNSGEIIRSVDEGHTWQLVTDIGTAVLDMDHVNNSKAYALTQNTLHVTNDQGSNWQEIPVAVQIVQDTTNNPYGYITQNRASSVNGQTVYDVEFDHKLNGVIFLASEQGLLRSIDSGSNWTVMSLPVTNETLKVSSVAINPSNSNSLLIAVGSTLFKTSNGGVTWETRKLPTEQKVRQILINPDQPNIVYLGMGER